MSDKKEMQEITTLIDFDGIENITKFKYRQTPPKYPKPGTFYWVEEMVYDERDGETKPKWGLWYSTNHNPSDTKEGEYGTLVRLDSKMYELVVRDDDGYIQITDKDIFDRQEIYLIIGKYIKEDYTIKVNPDDKGVRIFKITNPENRGLATVEATVEYVSDSNNMLYMSNVEDYWWVGKRLGDIRIHDNKESLRNNTISEILDTIIYPTLQPEIIEPSVELKINGYEEEYNVINIKDIINPDDNYTDIGSVKNWIDSTNWDVKTNRGHLTYPTAEPDDETGEQYILYNYAGKPCAEENYEKHVPEIKSSPDDIYDFSIGVEFEDGYPPLDNKRQRAKKDYDDILDKCKCENEEGCDECLIPQFKKSTVTSNVQKFSVVYPIFTNGGQKIVHYEKDYPIDYNNLDNNSLILEFPSEVDGYSEDVHVPTKAYVDVVEHLMVELYQFNELSREYDIPVDLLMKGIVIGKKDGLDNVNYVRYSRADRYNTNDCWYDTQIKPVKYKITIKRK